MSDDSVFSPRVLPFQAVSPLGKPRGRSLSPPNPKKRGSERNIDDVRKRKEAFIASSELVKTVQNRKDTSEMLQNLKLELAREAASLQFQQLEAEDQGETDTSALALKRIKAIKEIVIIESSIAKLGVTMLDLKGERFQKVFRYFLECIREAALEVLTPEQFDLFFNRLESRLENWEERAQEL